MVTTIRFKINSLPQTRNSIGAKHWRYRHKESKLWHDLVYLEICGQIPPKPFTKVELSFIRASSSMPDYDGLVSSFKYVLDALVKHGVLIDDNLNVCSNPNYSWLKTKRGQGYIQVEVKQCSMMVETKSS